MLTLFNYQSMKPILKYTGSKCKELPEIRKYIPQFSGKYIEPFVGGGAVFFDLEPQNALLGDANNDLILFYLTLQDHFEDVNSYLSATAEKINAMDKEHRVAFFYDIRNKFNDIENISCIERAEYYYVLNQMSFSHMMRYNKDGKFNAPADGNRKFNLLITQKHIDLLNSAVILNAGFDVTMSHAEKDDFIFLDPPYDTTDCRYTAGRFGTEQQIQLADTFKACPGKALLVVKETDLMNKLYSGYIKTSFDKIYTVNNKYRKAVKHLVIANYETTGM